MYSATSGLVFLALLTTACGQSAFSRCHILYERETCFVFYNALKNSLLANPQNIYELQRAFYPMGRFTTESLINVLYSVNISEEVFNNPPCPKTTNSLNTSNETVVQVLIGWTDSQIFNIISPLQLAELQLQIANVIYGLFTIPGGGVPLQESFGWIIKDALNDQVNLKHVNLLPINMSLNETSISCVPDTMFIKSVLEDITIFLKIWASTDGDLPEEINEKNLGFISEPGFQIDELLYQHENQDQIIFRPFFAAMLATIGSILGLCTIVGLGIALPKIYLYLSEERRQFRYYFFALSITLVFINMIIIIVDMANIHRVCQRTHYHYITNSYEQGCSGIIVTKIIYFILAIIFSLLSSALSARFMTGKFLGLVNTVLRKCEPLIYVMCCWSIILFASLFMWAIAPTLLMVIVYPNVILPWTVLVLASIFWLTVVLTIPQIFLHNFRMNTQCLDSVLFILPFGAMVVIILLIGFITVTYINSVLFGSDIGGPIGLLFAAIPSIFLTFFSEFYRDWFLTRTSEVIDRHSKSLNDMSTMEITSLPNKGTAADQSSIVIQNSSSTDHNAGAIPQLGTLFEEEEANTIKPVKTLQRGRRHVVKRRRSTRLISTGEPPGFLFKQLQYITQPMRQRGYTS